MYSIVCKVYTKKSEYLLGVATSGVKVSVCSVGIARYVGVLGISVCSVCSVSFSIGPYLVSKRREVEESDLLTASSYFFSCLFFVVCCFVLTSRFCLLLGGRN